MLAKRKCIEEDLHQIWEYLLPAETLNVAAAQEQNLCHSAFPFWHRYFKIALLPLVEHLTVWVLKVVWMNLAVFLDPYTPFVQLCIADYTPATA